MTNPHSAGIHPPTITSPDTQRTLSFLGKTYHLRLASQDTNDQFG
ncbi:MAG TPA: hypothetical protein VIL34_21660 [Actinopolymorphaceae bacterium]|jgi:hypothetical protein